MNISETQAMKARIAELEAKVAALEMAQTGQKSPESPVRDIQNGQKATLSLRKN